MQRELGEDHDGMCLEVMGKLPCSIYDSQECRLEGVKSEFLILEETY